MSENHDIAVSAVASEEIPPASHRKSHNSKYHLIFNPAMALPEKWVSFPSSFVAGQTNTRKQVTLHGAAVQRGIKIKTRIRGEVVYLKYVGPDPRLKFKFPEKWTSTPAPTVPEESDFLGHI